MAERRLTARRSFLDAAFMKNLESALRFGCPLLVHDVENIDPVVNPVLNREIYKKGGRVLIRLGDQVRAAVARRSPLNGRTNALRTLTFRRRS